MIKQRRLSFSKTPLASPGGGGGILRFGLDGGVPLKPRKSYPLLGVIFLGKNPTFFTTFGCVCMANTESLANFERKKNEPIFKGIFVKSGTHV